MKILVPAVIFAILMCSCTAKNPEQPAETKETSEPVSEISSAAFSECEFTETTEPTQSNEPVKSAEQQRLERLILDVRGTAVIPAFNEEYCPPESYALFPMLFGDFDKDGTEELFAVYGVAGGYENAAARKRLAKSAQTGWTRFTAYFCLTMELSV